MNPQKTKEYCSSLILQLDFFADQPNLYYRKSTSQKTFFGMTLSIILFVIVIFLFCYNLFYENNSLETNMSYGLQYHIGIYQNPIFFALLYDNGTVYEENLDEYSFSFSHSWDDPLPIYKCNKAEKYFQFDKIIKDYEPDWKNFYCLDYDALKEIYADESLPEIHTLYIKLVPKVISPKNLTFKINYLTHEVDTKSRNKGVKYKLTSESFPIDLDLYILGYSYFSVIEYEETGNLFIKSKKTQSYPSYEFTTVTYADYMAEYFRDEEGDLISYEVTYGKILFKLYPKSVIYNKKYNNVYVLIGNLGGWIHISSIIATVIYKFFFKNLITLNMIENLIGDDVFNYNAAKKNKFEYCKNRIGIKSNSHSAINIREVNKENTIKEGTSKMVLFKQNEQNEDYAKKVYFSKEKIKIFNYIFPVIFYKNKSSLKYLFIFLAEYISFENIYNISKTIYIEEKHRTLNTEIIKNNNYINYQDPFKGVPGETNELKKSKMENNS